MRDSREQPAPPPRETTITTWSEACDSAAKLLEKQYRRPGMFKGNFWFGGNALHAYLTSRLAVGKADDTRLLEYAFNTVYGPAHIDVGIWRDDYGWWGNAFCLAIRNRTQLGFSDRSNDTLFADLLVQAEYCWTQMDEFWRDKPYSATNDNAQESAAITGGTFNNKPDSVQTPMSGRNCVSNTGFWLLSRQLHGITKEPQYGDRARDESRWFDAWLTTPGPGQGVLSADGLVLERPTGHQLASRWHWTGDQGLFLTAWMWQEGTVMGPPFPGSVAARVAEATISRMTDAQGVLHEDLSFDQEPDLEVFLADYATGKGIFLRNLSNVTQTYLGGFWTQQNALPFFSVNARSVWRGRDPETGQLPFNWNLAAGGEPKVLTGKSVELCALITQASGLDALSAAARHLPTEEIEEIDESA